MNAEVTTVIQEPERQSAPLSTMRRVHPRTAGSFWPFSRLFGEIRENWSLLRYQFLAELKSAHTGTILGPLWWLLEPLLTMGIYVVLLGMILRAGRPHYAIFILCGLLPWHVHAKTLSSGAASLIRASGLIRALRFPHSIMVLTPVLTNMVNGMIGLGLLLAAMPFFFEMPSWHVLLVPVLLGLQSLFSVALAFGLAIANVYIRDIQRLLDPALRIWYFLSPALFSMHDVQRHAPQIAPWLFINPFATYLEAFRAVIMEHQMPHWDALAIWTGISFVLLWMSLWYFYRADVRVARLL